MKGILTDQIHAVAAIGDVERDHSVAHIDTGSESTHGIIGMVAEYDPAKRGCRALAGINEGR